MLLNPPEARVAQWGLLLIATVIAMVAVAISAQSAKATSADTVRHSSLEDAGIAATAIGATDAAECDTTALSATAGPGVDAGPIQLAASNSGCVRIRICVKTFTISGLGPGPIIGYYCWWECVPVLV